MIKSKITGMTVALASLLALGSSAMAFEQPDRMQSERSFYDSGAGFVAPQDVLGNAYGSAQRTENRSSRVHNGQMQAAPDSATRSSDQRAIDRLSERQS
jgi:hypothetical protein